MVWAALTMAQTTEADGKALFAHPNDPHPLST